MIQQLLILAEGGTHTEGIPPYYVGGGMFILLLSLLGITYLFSGQHQPKRGDKDGESGDHTGTGHSEHSSGH